MHVQRSSICCSLCLPPKFTSRTVHSRRHAAALSCRRLRFACKPGQQWAPQNLDLYESCWLSLTGYSQCYSPIFAGQVLHGGPHTLGWLSGASGIGAFISALYLAVRKSVLGLTRLLQVAAALLAENAPQGDIKIDWQVTERNHIFGRESAAHKKYTNPLTALGGLELLLLRLDFLGPH